MHFCQVKTGLVKSHERFKSLYFISLPVWCDSRWVRMSYMSGNILIRMWWQLHCGLLMFSCHCQLNQIKTHPHSPSDLIKTLNPFKWLWGKKEAKQRDLWLFLPYEQEEERHGLLTKPSTAVKYSYFILFFFFRKYITYSSFLKKNFKMQIY